jgi:ABC-type transporter MlaC component
MQPRQLTKENKMKTIILSVVLAMCSVATTPVLAAAEVKEVCKDKLDKAGKPVKDKAGQVRQDCKKIRVHKKLEGTKVPEKK